MCPRDLTFFFPPRGRPGIGLNRRLPRITQRDILSTGWLESLISRPKDQPRRGSFAGDFSSFTFHFSPAPLPVIRSNQDRGRWLLISDATTKTGRGTQFTSRRVML